jgi:hypothetical protein
VQHENTRGWCPPCHDWDSHKTGLASISF